MFCADKKKIALVAPNWLGDAVVAAGALSGLAEAFPERVIDAVGRAGIAALLDGHAGVRRSWSYLLVMFTVLGFSGFYEALEGIVAMIVSPELGAAYLGTQGDEWDAQKDTALAFLGAVIAMVMVWSRVYNSTLFGIGGIIILFSFFAIVWVWMKKYAALDMPEKIAGSFKLIGYLFWINMSWFLCGETARMHLKAFEGKSPPVPIEVMVFLVLGWLFVLIGEYKAMRLRKS